jgi:hypothetical protein
MENKNVLFITFDMSGYYESVYEELKKRFKSVDFYNMAKISFKYKSKRQRFEVLYAKIFKKQNLKNFYKYNFILEETADKYYDLIFIVRPDLFFDSQLELLKSRGARMIAFYHDSISNISRKKDVIKYFDKVYSYEKADVEKYGLSFLPNFIYFNHSEYKAAIENNKVVFSVMSKDYRLKILEKVAADLVNKNSGVNFFVTDKEEKQIKGINYITKRLDNKTVIEWIKKSDIIVDIHKFGIQDGLTFRVFESLGFRKKLITTNLDIKSFDFFNPINIYVIEDLNAIDIPLTFLESPYEEINPALLNKYSVQNWIDAIVSNSLN